MVLTGRMRTAEEARPQPAPTSRPRARRAITGAAAVALPDLTGIAERAFRGVTNISRARRPPRTRRSRPIRCSAILRRRHVRAQRVAQSLGSGVIVSADGYMLTNNHVVGTRRRRGVGDARRTSASSRRRSSASTKDRPRACSRSMRAACRCCRGAIVEAQGRRVGAGDRQPVPVSARR